MTENCKAIICIVGRSDAGKTTFIEKLLPELNKIGLAVGTVKHDVHGFDIDHPGKDSYRHKKAGSKATIISSPQKMALIKDMDHDNTLDELCGYFRDMDLVISEGYKRENKPKIEVYREEVHPEPLCNGDSNLVALVTNARVDLGVPVFGLEDAAGVAQFIKETFIKRR